MKLLNEAEVAELERRNAAGFTSQEIVAIFGRRGVRLTTATFRKYVQMGLLPRARRVARGGRHAGSAGMYPPSTVRAVNLIKRMLAEDLTLEEIRQSFMLFDGELERIEKRLASVLERLEQGVRERAEGRTRQQLLGELKSARQEANRFVRRVRTVGRRMNKGISGSSASGGARGNKRTTGERRGA